MGLGKAAAAALCASLCCTLAASAQAQSERQNIQPQPREARRDNRWAEERDARQYEAREARQEERRRMEEYRDNGDASRRMGRMTPDERRDLRRQINEAGQQVYSLPPRR
ncbi:hypothetical protein [Pseudoduganella violaceinigra]|uniref:hypothetical protein n=1 Tax=Pseudoduganella violaceinigra TaxID=246602 RepID=UPI000684CB6A|nr:hypothetical protein [Pseudoduganella violaceinigra]